mmetsp:Transcript_35029/g.68978  ORF Transcript_35029/g.68978 Transcript_35029/m.68978 type:complete len:615 (-) Transcript_35029:44-1888(-)
MPRPPKKTMVVAVSLCLFLRGIPAASAYFKNPTKNPSVFFNLPSPLRLVAPEYVCISGHANPDDVNSIACPELNHLGAPDIGSYGVHLDPSSIVTVVLNGLRMGDENGRHRGDDANPFVGSAVDTQSGDGDGIRNGVKGGGGARELEKSGGQGHHIQVYLLLVEEYRDSVKSGTNSCCFEIMGDSPSLENQKSCKGYEQTGFRQGTVTKGKTGHLFSIPDEKPVGNSRLVARLRPKTAGRYMVVLSNCAADVTGLTVIARSGQISFASQFGSLPLNMMGILPFYVSMAVAYCLLLLVWLHRLITTVGPDASTVTRGSGLGRYCRRAGLAGALRSVLPLQRAVFYLVCCHCTFSILASYYYLRLNTVSVDVNVLYGGTAAALVEWGPLSGAVALAHFVTIFACQAVATLAADGTWLIHGEVVGWRCRGRFHQSAFAVAALGVAWAGFFLLYGTMSPKDRRRYSITCGILWIIFLLYSVSRSLSHLRSLIVGDEAERVLVGGGILNAKRGLFRKLYGIITIYPIIFIVALVLNSRRRKDAWGWVGFVLIDAYIFVLLVHSSFTWLPREMARQEYMKYAPVATVAEAGNDNDWDGDILLKRFSGDEDDDVSIEFQQK